MSTEVTLTLPDTVYRQVEATARRNQRTVIDVLTDTVTQAFDSIFDISPDREKMEEEQAAYERQREEIIAQYEGEYVAVHGGKMVDHDPDEIALLRRIDANYPKDVVHMRLVTRQPDRELRVTSAWFVK
ncbi:protein of unknown function [Candidatus Promineifilum breve]|uniref:DUF5678 domain-containing protein n=1 Tax=Candidatus Promineifilum breve TaxID=1806508 RepID=A0A160T4N2_9CHLR|nr:DUF5678 domain-containing protein [Candidatus Promineifilum breve]CUS04058.2 protein of unknown function [Candidatus Promineifilum breve]